MQEKDLLFVVLKEVLRKKKINYSDLAKEMNLSESSVKRIFSKRSCSIEQLSKVCEVAKVSLFDLMSMVKSRDLEAFTLSESEESYLAKNVECFLFYRQAVIHKDYSTVLENLKTDSKKASAYLKYLEGIDLLQLHPGDQFVFPRRGVLKLREGGVLQKALYQQWLPEFVDEALHATEDSYQAKIASMKVSKATRERFLNNYNELSQDLMNQAQLELRSGKAGLMPFSAALVVGPRRLGE